VSTAVEAVWRIEGARIVATLARITGDLGLAEDLAQEALVEALEQWPAGGTPRNPGAWLTAVAKRRAIDGWRRRDRLDDRYRAIAHDLAVATAQDWEPIDDDVLRLVFTACSPVLSRESQVALTLRVVGGLTTAEIARLLLVPVPTLQARITRAKKALAAAHVPFETPDPDQWPARLGGVLGVVYLIFTEGYSATSGTEWVRPELAEEALRLGRVLAGLVPREPEVHGLVALMELQASRFPARRGASGKPVLLEDQDRSRWDRAQIGRGRAALARATALGAPGPYALQAAIAEQHAVATSVATTDWPAIVRLYDALARVTANPVVQLNRAVAVSMAEGPATGLALVDGLAARGVLPMSHLLPSVRGELLARLGRADEAAAAFREAAVFATNQRIRDVLLAKAAAG
jgi:RNA polymerase sigma factor (sigma-70 family)